MSIKEVLEFIASELREINSTLEQLLEALNELKSTNPE
jgi:prefoldin subunit 5